MSSPRIAISVGDFNGVGPEIILKALAGRKDLKSTPVVVAPASVIEFYAKSAGLADKFQVISSLENVSDHTLNVLDIWQEAPPLSPGRLSRESGHVAIDSIEACIHFTKQKETVAMVTAPISKEAVNLAGFNIPGHTELLAKHCGVQSVLMMLVTKKLRVALVTAHIPVVKIAEKLTGALIIEKLDILYNSLKNDFGISQPSIAVLGLNPHAGDGGVIGREEIEIINPALLTARSRGYQVMGPFPADGFFGQHDFENFDAVLAMYHDQGLAPFKLLSFGNGVNYTAGLPIIRTSPDHGTAFNIAGKNQAQPASFIKAYTMAEQLAEIKSGA
jgi:4-hydroxythreonine-4-phosphate dehydrogenase